MLVLNICTKWHTSLCWWCQIQFIITWITLACSFCLYENLAPTVRNLGLTICHLFTELVNPRGHLYDSIKIIYLFSYWNQLCQSEHSDDVTLPAFLTADSIHIQSHPNLYLPMLQTLRVFHLIVTKLDCYLQSTPPWDLLITQTTLKNLHSLIFALCAAKFCGFWQEHNAMSHHCLNHTGEFQCPKIPCPLPVPPID